MGKKGRLKMEKYNGEIFKKEGQELQLYFHFKKRGFRIDNKKGKGSYDRNKSKREKYDY